jgi:hypothetical protein
MPYTVKLKNQAGIEVNYSDIENVTIPLASGSGNATFMARYGVTKYASSNLTYDGGEYTANGVDYMCRMSTGSTGKYVPDSIKVKIGGTEAVAGLAYVYTKLTNLEAIVKVNGSYITGAIEIEAMAVTPKA